MKNYAVALFLFVAASSPAVDKSAATFEKLATTSDKLSMLDATFRERHDATNARAALDGYRKLHAAFPHDVGGAWRLAMATVFVGMRLATDDDEKKRLFAEGRDAGRVAIALDPKCVGCEFWTGVNMALYGQAVGPFKTLFTLKEVKQHLERSLELDRSYAYGGAYRILGNIDWKLPGILGGDNDRAREFFKKAIDAAPDEPMNYVVLALLLRKDFDDDEGALSIVRAGLRRPKPSHDRVESLDAYEELRTIAEELTPKVATSDRRQSTLD